MAIDTGRMAERGGHSPVISHAITLSPYARESGLVRLSGRIMRYKDLGDYGDRC
jgi:hypothetical protein